MSGACGAVQKINYSGGSFFSLRNLVLNDGFFIANSFFTPASGNTVIPKCGHFFFTPHRESTAQHSMVWVLPPPPLFTQKKKKMSFLFFSTFVTSMTDTYTHTPSLTMRYFIFSLHWESL